MALMILNLGLSIGSHGTPRLPENGWITLWSFFISAGLVTLAVFDK
jgi:hypothetical protein